MQRRLAVGELLEQRALCTATPWYSDQWAHRQPISIPAPSSIGTQPLNDFPVLISATRSDWRTVDNGGDVVNAQGADFLFTAADGQTELDFELESFDPETGTLVGWVRIPSLSGELDTEIFAYYGSSAVNVPSRDTGVWSTYQSVYHYNEQTTHTTNACAATVCDSTANGYHLTGSVSLTDNYERGVAGTALSFAALDAPLYAQNYVVQGNTLTLSTWFWADNKVASNYLVALPRTQTNNGFDLQLTDSIKTNLNASNYRNTSFFTNYANEEFHQLVATYDGIALQLYYDGELVAWTPQSGIANLSANMLAVGGFSELLPQFKFSGVLDETRIANEAKSAAWIATEYSNQSNPNQFYNLGLSESYQLHLWNSVPREERAAAPWYSDEWNYRNSLLVPAGKISGTQKLYNFPLLVSGTRPEWRSVAHGGSVINANGADFVVTADDGRSQLPFELESYDPQTGKLEGWVRVPELTPQIENEFFVYFGSSLRTLPGSSERVWKSYQSSYHYASAPASIAIDCESAVCDSSINNHDLTGQTITQANMTSGVVGTALDFSGLTNGLNVGNYVVNGQSLTLSTWFKTSSPSDISYLVALPRTPTNNGFDLLLDAAVSTNITTPTYYSAASSSSYADGAFHFLAATYDGSTIKLYFDGSLVATTVVQGTAKLDLKQLWVGGFSEALSSHRFRGILDETRIASNVKSADWIQTEYRNLISPQDFYQFADVELRPGSLWFDSLWQFRKPLTLSNVAANAQAIEEPVLIEVSSPDWRSTNYGGQMQSSTAADLRFTSADGTSLLDFELASYDPTSGKVVAWVKVPRYGLMPETRIYAYYGNGLATSASNPAQVWRDYKSVYHFDNTPEDALLLCGATVCDVAGNNHHLFGSGLSQLDLVNGIAGSALSLENATNGLTASNYSIVGNHLTMSVWFTADEMVDSEYLLALPKTLTNNGFDLQLNYLALNGNVFTNHWDQASAARNYFDSQYHQLAATFDGTNAKLYFDGQQVASLVHPGQLNLGLAQLFVGGFSTALDDLRFHGVVDEVRIAERVMTAEEIAFTYQNMVSGGSFIQIGTATERFDSSAWIARMDLTIDNTESLEDLIDYPVELQVTYREGMKPDFSDLRFLSRDGYMSLPFWIESFTPSATANVWINVPFIPALSNTSLWMLYGNENASSAANGGATFSYFDAFNDNVINTGLWDVTSGYPQEYNDQLIIKDEPESLRSKFTLTPGYAIRSRTWFESRGTTQYGISDAHNGSVIQALTVTSVNPRVSAISDQNSGHSFTDAETNVWRTWEILWNETTAQVVNQESKESSPLISHGSNQARIVATSTFPRLQFDWIAVRKIIANPPVAELGTEQGNPLHSQRFSANFGQWDQLAETVPNTTTRFAPRDSGGELVFNGAMWVLGGWVESQGRVNDVWKSTDGVNWTRVVEHAPWEARNLAGVTVFNGRMWIAGGLSTNSFDDVWSSADGVHWTQEIEHAPFGPRGAFTLTSFNGKMFVIGGMNFRADTIFPVHYNDVWSSVDGKNWILETVAPFPARSAFNTVAFNNRLWVFGGGVYDRQFITTNYNDVWSSADGVTWQQEASAPWGPRRFANAVVHRGYIYIIGGNHRGNLSDVWATSDGTNWVEVVENRQYSDRHEPLVYSFENSLWVIAGLGDRLNNDVWRHL